MDTVIQRFLWYAFLATIAWQTRVILWQADPVFWEWRSVSVWFSDGLILALLVCAIWQGWRPRLVGRDILLAFFFAAAIVSWGYADHVGVALYQLVRLGYFILFYIYLRQWAFQTFDTRRSALAFVGGAVSQAMIGILQFIVQHDLGLRWIGETVLRTDMRGVAVFYNLAHEKVLRAYGTMPHPNVLAIYFVLAIGVLMWLWVRYGTVKHASRVGYGLFLSAGTVLLWGLGLTFSRTVILAGGGAFAAVMASEIWAWSRSRWVGIEGIRRRLLQAASCIAVLSVLFCIVHWDTLIARTTIAASDESIRLRVRYAQDAFSSGGEEGIRVNWFGVGIGNFTTWLMRYDSSLPRFMYQPVHNVYLLIYTEVGLIGVVFWISWLSLFIWHIWRSHHDQPVLHWGVVAMLGALLFIGFFDHFFWTLQQGRILWWLSLAVAAGRERG
jgi:O-antigen ligase